MIRKILVAVDGSEPSEHALNLAVEHALKWKAELIIVSVIPPVSPVALGLGPTPLYLDQYIDDLKKLHQSILTESNTEIKLKHPEIKIGTRLKEGRPADLIVETAREENVDLIVMGSRGMGGISGWILGSTSRSVVDSCTKPILIVK